MTTSTYLHPDVIAKAQALGLKARTHRRRSSRRRSQKSLPRLFRRVRPAPRIRPRRRHPPHRLEKLRPLRALHHQAIRARNQLHRPHLARRQPLDALRRRRRPTSWSMPSCWRRRWLTRSSTSATARAWQFSTTPGGRSCRPAASRATCRLILQALESTQPRIKPPSPRCCTTWPSKPGGADWSF